MKAKLIKHGHSYALLKDGKLIAFAHPEDFSNDHTIGKLSLKNCQAIERGYDLDELAKECAETAHTMDELYENGLFYGFMSGFQKALEILGDKKFTEEDVLEVVIYVLNKLVLVEGFDRKFLFPESIYQEATTKCKSLQQNEWDVEIEMEDVIGNLHETHHTNPTLSFPKQPIVYGERPKLDADGCLILKRV